MIALHRLIEVPVSRIPQHLTASARRLFRHQPAGIIACTFTFRWSNSPEKGGTLLRGPTCQPRPGNWLPLDQHMQTIIRACPQRGLRPVQTLQGEGQRHLRAAHIDHTIECERLRSITMRSADSRLRAGSRLLPDWESQIASLRYRRSRPSAHVPARNGVRHPLERDRRQRPASGPPPPSSAIARRDHQRRASSIFCCRVRQVATCPDQTAEHRHSATLRSNKQSQLHITPMRQQRLDHFTLGLFSGQDQRRGLPLLRSGRTPRSISNLSTGNDRDRTATRKNACPLPIGTTAPHASSAQSEIAYRDRRLQGRHSRCIRQVRVDARRQPAHHLRVPGPSRRAPNSGTDSE